MLLAIGVVGFSLGYTVFVYGQRLAVRHPQTFAYLVGLSPDGTMDTTSSGSSTTPPPARSSSGKYAATPKPVRPDPSGALR